MKLDKFIAGATLVCFAVSARSAHAQVKFSAIHSADSAAYQKWVQGLDKQGMRPVFIHGNGQGQTPHFAASAVDDGTRPAWSARHNISAEQYQQAFTELVDKGYRLLSVSGYRNGNNTSFAAIWVKDGQKDAWQARHDLTSQDYQNVFTSVTKKGFRPVHVTGYGVGNEHRLAAIFVADQVKNWVARHDITADQYQATVTEWSKKGYRPVSVSAYSSGGQTRFAVVMADDGTKSAWLARHHLTSEQYQNLFQEQTQNGYRPTQVVSYPWEGGTRYAAVFVKPAAKPQPLPMSGPAVPDLNAFDKAMQKFMQDRSIQAGTLAVMRDGRLVLTRGYGYADRERKKPLGPDAPMRLASIGKPITLAAILKLIRQGKLKLDTRPFVLLAIQPPRGRKMDPRLLDVTVQHLMKHEGGWSREAAYDPMFRPLIIAEALSKTGPATAQDVIHYMAGQPLQFTPGSKSVYSNFGYCILGRVIERVSGKKYTSYVRDEILAPLGVRTVDQGRSLPRDRSAKEPVYLDPGSGRNVLEPASKAQVPGPDGTFYLEAMDSHGGLIMSAPDMARFLGAYWMSGQPRKAGQKGEATFFGSLPGTWTMARQRTDGVNIVALFNQRADGSGLRYEPIREVLDAAADSIRSWPAGT